MRSVSKGLLLALTVAGCATAGPRRRETQEDPKLLWAEAVATFDGAAYTYSVHVLPTQAAADACRRLLPSRCPGDDTWREAGARYNEIPLALRERVGALVPGQSSATFPAPPGRGVMIVHLHRKTPAKFVGQVDPGRWLATYAATALPAPEALRSDPALVLRRALNSVRNAADLESALARGEIAPANLDARTSSGWTLLVKSVLLNDLALARALLERGASPDACGRTSCPLQIAVALANEPAVRLLLAFKADPNGPAGVDETPLIVASERADRAMAQLLLDAGADPLRPGVLHVGAIDFRRAVLFYAPASDPAYLEWLAGVVHTALARDGRFAWSGWIEQDGRRAAITEGASVVLNRAPFRVRLRVRPETSLRVVASEDGRLLDMSRTVAFRRALLGEGRVGAASGESRFLAVRTIAWRKDGELDPSVGTDEWGFFGDPRLETGTKRLADGSELERVVETLVTDAGEVRLADYRGRALAVVMGVAPPIGASGDLFAPVRFTIAFRDPRGKQAGRLHNGR